MIQDALTQTALPRNAPPRPPRWERRIRRGGLIALAGLVAWVIVGIPVFVLPHADPVPAHADVALVLGGDTSERIETAERLLRDGTVDEMLWSTPKQTDGEPNWLLDGPCRTQAHLTCFVPEPSTTQGEARELGALAAERGWTSAIVITQTAHIDRARLIVDRCFSGRLTMVESGEGPSGGWTYQYLYQTLATVKAWIHPGC